MKPATAIIFLHASAASASLVDTILPANPPTITSEPWQCTTEMLPQYFDPPKPTGALLTAIYSYGDEIQKGCEPTETDIYGLPECTFPPKSLWCGFSTAVPSSLVSSYSSYGSVASSWWSARSSTAVELAQSCPIRWYRAMLDMPAGPGWLNTTLVFAGCYEEAHHTTGSSTKATATATTGSKATSSGPKPTTTTTTTAAAASKSNSVVGRAESIGMWIVAGTGLAATMVNSML